MCKCFLDDMDDNDDDVYFWYRSCGSDRSAFVRVYVYPCVRVWACLCARVRVCARASSPSRWCSLFSKFNWVSKALDWSKTSDAAHSRHKKYYHTPTPSDCRLPDISLNICTVVNNPRQWAFKVFRPPLTWPRNPSLGRSTLLCSHYFPPLSKSQFSMFSDVCK